MEPKAIVVLITAPSPGVGAQIADTLIDQKLAACVNLLPPITSYYTWEGETRKDEEVLVVVKTRLDMLQERLIPAILAIHPYQVPEIIALPVIEGLGSYLDWINESVQ